MSPPQNQIDPKQLRLTVIIMLPVDSIDQAQQVYNRFKNDVGDLGKAIMTGNVTKMFDPCCGKEGKKGG